MMHRILSSVQAYCANFVSNSGKQFRSGRLFVKILTQNDDSGRHGVLVPTEAYDFFPDLCILDKNENATTYFTCFDWLGRRPLRLSYKYYQRYPERRITCLNADFSDRESGTRLAIFLLAIEVVSRIRTGL